MLKEKRVFGAYYSVLLALCIISMYPWFTHGVSSAYFSVSGCCVSLAVFSVRRKEFDSGVSGPVLGGLLCFMVWTGLHLTTFGLIETGLNFVILYILLRLDRTRKRELLAFITKYFAIFVGISLAAYIVWLSGVPLPRSVAFEGSPYECSNFYAFIMDENYVLLPRFKSVFAEPGHMTMGLVPLIVANRFNIKNRHVRILFVAELFSLSLAGLICLLLSWMMFQAASWRRHALGTIVATVIVTIGLFQLYQRSKSQDSQLYYTVFERVERYGSGNSDQFGDRFKSNTLAAYNRLMNSPQRYWGLGYNPQSEAAIEGSSGYKVYILLYGIVGLVLVIVFYGSLYLRCPSPARFILLLVYAMLFVQNAYPLWYVFIIIYILGISALDHYEGSVLPSRE